MLSMKLLSLAIFATVTLAKFELYQAPKKFLSEEGGMKAFKAEYGHRFNFPQAASPNDRPMIGVLTQPLPDELKKDPRFAGKSSYIMASYINHLESAGARTVPLIYDGDL